MVLVSFMLDVLVGISGTLGAAGLLSLSPCRLTIFPCGLSSKVIRLLK